MFISYFLCIKECSLIFIAKNILDSYVQKKKSQMNLI